MAPRCGVGVQPRPGQPTPLAISGRPPRHVELRWRTSGHVSGALDPSAPVETGGVKCGHLAEGRDVEAVMVRKVERVSLTQIGTW